MITPTRLCGWCAWPLPVDGPSPDFCCEAHQQAWQAANNVGRPTAAELGARAKATFTGLSATMAALRCAFAAIRQITRTTVDAYVRAGVLQSPKSVDPMQRALQLRRTRNTGPVANRRPPKRIDPTRGHR